MKDHVSMTLIKRVVIMTLFVLINSMHVHAHVFEAKNSDGVTIIYQTLSSNTCSAISCSELGGSGKLVIPSTVQDQGILYTVTSIGHKAFCTRQDIRFVTIPNSVTSIGDCAFAACRCLESVTIPNSVTSIGNSAFFWCWHLESVTIPNSVTSIGDSAFEQCYRLKSVTIPNSVTSIGKDAFSSCRGLTSVTIPNSVTYIGENAFAYCFSLLSIVVEKDNADYRDINGVLFTKDKTELLTYPAGREETLYVIPHSVTSIGIKAFSGCSLTSLFISNSVTSVGDSAFAYCGSLEVINLTDGMTERKAKDLYAWNEKVRFKQVEQQTVFDPKVFPVINIHDIVFVDNGNKRIDANEKCSVKLTVTNSGKGAAVGCKAKVDISGVTGLTANDVMLPTIAPGDTATVNINFVANMNIPDGKAQISVSIDEPNGFGCDPVQLSIETKAFEAPKYLPRIDGGGGQ